MAEIQNMGTERCKLPVLSIYKTIQDSLQRVYGSLCKDESKFYSQQVCFTQKTTVMTIIIADLLNKYTYTVNTVAISHEISNDN